MGNKEILDAEPWTVSNALGIAAKDTLSAKDEPILIFYNLGHLEHTPGKPGVKRKA